MAVHGATTCSPVRVVLIGYAVSGIVPLRRPSRKLGSRVHLLHFMLGQRSSTENPRAVLRDLSAPQAPTTGVRQGRHSQVRDAIGVNPGMDHAGDVTYEVEHISNGAVSEFVVTTHNHQQERAWCPQQGSTTARLPARQAASEHPVRVEHAHSNTLPENERPWHKKMKEEKSVAKDNMSEASRVLPAVPKVGDCGVTTRTTRIVSICQET